MLERIQRRVAKMIQNLRYLIDKMRLKESGLANLGTRRLRRDQIQILNGYTNIGIHICFFLLLLRMIQGLEDMKLH